MDSELTQPISNEIWGEAERNPKLHTLTGRRSVTGKAKRSGHYADDGVGLFIEFDGAAQDFSIAAILVLPQVMRKNYNVAHPGQSLSLAEGSADRRRDAQKRK